MAPKKCCAARCEDTTSTRHRFPLREEDVFNVWIERIKHPRFPTLTKRQIYDSYVICHHHFEPDCYITRSKKLRKRCVPTLYLPDFHEHVDIIPLRVVIY